MSWGEETRSRQWLCRDSSAVRTASWKGSEEGKRWTGSVQCTARVRGVGDAHVNLADGALEGLWPGSRGLGLSHFSETRAAARPDSSHHSAVPAGAAVCVGVAPTKPRRKCVQKSWPGLAVLRSFPAPSKARLPHGPQMLSGRPWPRRDHCGKSSPFSSCPLSSTLTSTAP